MYPTIFDEHFLLSTKMGERLYHEYAESLPIIDYHNHLSPQQLAENQSFANLTQLWLAGDHYKWRAMRILGVDEAYITGDASDEQKFIKWSECVPRLVRNPLFHWTHLELKNSFGIHEYLTPENAPRIYARCQEMLCGSGYGARDIVNKYKVEYIGTTDDPMDTLEYHSRSEEDSLRVAPSFRPDKLLNIGDPVAFRAYLVELGKSQEKTIQSFDDLMEVIDQSLEYFHVRGCRMADHGLSSIPIFHDWTYTLDVEFKKFLEDKSDTPFSAAETFRGLVLYFLSKRYSAYEWVQQYHVGAMRNTNTRLYRRLGADAGADSIGDDRHIEKLAILLDHQDVNEHLPKTILYNLNPADNEALCALCGNFTEEGVVGKVQFGAAWWYLDQLDGMKKQLNCLSNLGVLSTFIGMTTDSRSLLSFSRHEYFRRLLCDIIGRDVAKGLLPNDAKWLGEIVQNISYYNIDKYLDLPRFA